MEKNKICSNCKYCECDFDIKVNKLKEQQKHKRTHRDDGTIIGSKYDSHKDYDVTRWKLEK